MFCEIWRKAENQGARGCPVQFRGPTLFLRHPTPPCQTMSSAIARRVTAAHALARRSPARPLLPASARTYASPAEEPDPQLAGYPQLPWVSRQTLPPRGWQDEQMRRNFGETVRFFVLYHYGRCLMTMCTRFTNKMKYCRCGDLTPRRFGRRKR